MRARPSRWTTMRLRRWEEEAIPPGILAGVTLLFFLRLYVPRMLGRMVIVRGDFTEEFFALHAFAYKAQRHGHLPLWNADTYAGYPFLADIQSAVFYPPHPILDEILILLSASRLPVWALESMLPLHVFLAARFTYALARSEHLGRAPGLLAGLSFGFGGFLLSYPLQQLSILETVTWLPAALAMLSRAMQARNRRTRVHTGTSESAGHSDWRFSPATRRAHCI